MSNIDKRALREAAEKAISEEGETWWSEEQLASDYGLALHKADAKFIAAANPATVLALLNEIAELEQRHCGTALLEREEMHTKTLGRMLDELDAKDRRIAELELKLEAAEMRIAELGELLKKSDVEKKQPQNTLSDRPVYLGDGSDAKEKVIAGKRDIHRYESFITDRAGKGD
ncbi:ead/Ea22-like family protein [Enterobacter kobei]|uniref:ead/Ea22-like family protein n=1 Tax=Enterobacter kobei TaxID=208224 RepID=UPI002A75E540|nr:ead/Ea22-like family protein [Enterobacter kobei]MDY3593854.1 ead/Ea22-like family protein [Enterobacter kobei]